MGIGAKGNCHSILWFYRLSNHTYIAYHKFLSCWYVKSKMTVQIGLSTLLSPLNHHSGTNTRLTIVLEDSTCNLVLSYSQSYVKEQAEQNQRNLFSHIQYFILMIHLNYIMRTRESMANNVQRYYIFMKKQIKLTKNLLFMQKNHPFCNFCYKKDEFILFEYHLEIYDYFTRITKYLLVDQNFEGFSIRRTYCLFASCSSL